MTTKSKPRGPGRNFIPQVRLRGTSCSLKRHFRGALRQVIGRWDYLAEHDPERFVWESLSNTARNCTNYKSGERYTLRWVESVKAVARSLGLITVQVQRVRYGVLRDGFILADHDKIAEKQLANANKRIAGSYCVMDISRGADSAGQNNRSVLSSVVSSVVSSGDGSVVSSGANAKQFGDEFGAKFGAKLQQPVNESSECGRRGKVLPEFCQSFASSNLLVSETFNQSDTQTTAKCAVDSGSGSAYAVKKNPEEKPSLTQDKAMEPMTDAEYEKRKAFLRSQAEQLNARYGAKAKAEQAA